MTIKITREVKHTIKTFKKNRGVNNFRNDQKNAEALWNLFLTELNEQQDTDYEWISYEDHTTEHERKMDSKYGVDGVFVVNGEPRNAGLRVLRYRGYNTVTIRGEKNGGSIETSAITKRCREYEETGELQVDLNITLYWHREGDHLHFSCYIYYYEEIIDVISRNWTIRSTPPYYEVSGLNLKTATKSGDTFYYIDITRLRDSYGIDPLMRLGSGITDLSKLYIKGKA